MAEAPQTTKADDNLWRAYAVLRLYFWPDEKQRADWWATDYGGTPSVNVAVTLIREALS